jgi:single-strand DNA-binding protein
MNLNKVFLIGRLTGDPQLRSTQGGQPISTFSVATNRTWINKAGQKQDEAQFHNVVVWGKQAEIVSRFLKKGSTVMVEGRIQTRAYVDKTGQNRTATEIVCERFQFGPRAGMGGGAGFGAEAAVGGASAVAADSFMDEMKDDEPLPEINLEEDESGIKAEDIPF